MSVRGRGTLEVRPTSNPFYVTSSSVAQLAFAPREFNAPKVMKLAPPPDPYMPEVDFRFLYTRESDKIGKGVPLSDNRLSDTFRKTSISSVEAAKRKGMGKNHVTCDSEEQLGYTWRDVASKSKRTAPPSEALEGLLSKFNHAPKCENPLYTTTNNEIGIKKPTVASFTFERKARAQAFSRSFPTKHNRDTGLNTSVTRSCVHSALDPQFI